MTGWGEVKKSPLLREAEAGGEGIAKGERGISVFN
jgi:hypothetical protein